MESLPSLTRLEAQERARLVSVDRYDVDIDLTDMVDGDAFRAVSRIEFSCREPGASTFVDCALEVVSATLNGAAVDGDKIGGARIGLADLADQNVLVVQTVQRNTAHGEWVHRFVDPSDKEVYVWTSFEPDDARRAWACFDQPDLKAPFAFTVTAPSTWRVVSNSGDAAVEDMGETRRWTFPDTPALSTYVPVVNAGPFHEIRSERAGFDLGLMARKSLTQFLNRDADELFEVTAQGLIFFGDRFALPFPQRKYDQVFLPDMGGAMENYGCVSWSDAFVYRSEPTHAERESRALVLLHEMAHMWFGDIVTMRWWEDLWLNEAFAEWACHWAAEAATRFTEAWSGFLAAAKLAGYRADLAPTTHPIRQPVDDVAAAAASFDGITYPKGASVLKQLAAYLGEDAFIAGLRLYFARHAWGNTSLDDLMAALAEASGRDLTAWTEGWLDTAGTDRLQLVSESGGFALRATGPDGAQPRTHRLHIGAYARDGQELTRRQLVSVETTGEVTSVPDLAAADILLVNDDDLTFASVLPDPRTAEFLLSAAGELPTAVARAVAVTTAWDLLRRAEIGTAEFVDCVTAVLATETAPSVIEPYLHLAVEAAEGWAPEAARETMLSQVAETCLQLLDDPARRQVALRALARTAVTDVQVDRLRSEAAGDVDLRWRTLIRLAELGAVDADEVASLRSEDPNPDSWVRALAVDAARPDPAAKEAVWSAVVEEHRVPMGSLGEVRRAFWRPGQGRLLAPYAYRYLDVLPTLHTLGMIPALSVSSAMYPAAGVDSAFADRAIEAAGRDGVSPAVAKTVIEKTDELRRMLVARGDA
jgi:aminopeptidase N